MKSGTAELEILSERLRSVGLKVTPQRIEVFRAICCSDSHPSVAEIFEAVRSRLPSVSMDTVYRTLWTLSELGLVNPVSSSAERVRFDSNIDRHHHFICARCGAISDFQAPSLDSLAVPEEAKRLGVVWGAHVEVRGLCRGCSEKGTSTEEEGG